MNANKTKGVLLALAVGACGGYAFYRLSMPLAWMLGSMLSVAAVAIAGGPVALSFGLRTVMVAILGTLLGSSFTPEIFEHATHWIGGVMLMLVFVTAMTSLSVLLYVRWGGFDRVTAYFSGTPGGLAVMTLIGEQQGGNAQVIPLVHATRIFIVVSAIPLYLLVVEHVNVPRGASMFAHAAQASPHELVILAGCAALGLIVSRVLHIPGSQILAPMLISAAAYIAGLVHAPPPRSLIAAAQVVIGAGIGVRFAGLRLSWVAWPMGLAVISALGMLTAATVLATLASPVLGVSLYALLLALAPGGLAEMSMIALALGVDTAFIATMHIVRIILVVSLAPIAFRLLGWGRPAGAD